MKINAGKIILLFYIIISYPTQPIAQVSDKKSSLNKLMVDLAAHEACRRLRGRILSLSSQGASAEGGQKETVGNMWIDSCEATEAAPESLKLEMTGKGWRWLSRQRRKFGAEFALNDVMKFAATIRMTGTFDLAYDPKSKIVTAWFLLDQPPKIDMDVTGDVDVDPEGIWSSILGEAASLVGQAPAQRAQKAIRVKARKKFKEKITPGLTLVINLCTSKRYTKFGTYPAGKLPESADTSGGSSLAEGRAVLHKELVFLAGPFKTKTPLTATFKNERGGAVQAAFACEKDVKKAARAYVKGGPFPRVPRLKSSVIRSKDAVELHMDASARCPVVLLLRTWGDHPEKSVVDYRIFRSEARQTALLNC